MTEDPHDRGLGILVDQQTPSEIAEFCLKWLGELGKLFQRDGRLVEVVRIKRRVDEGQILFQAEIRAFTRERAHALVDKNIMCFPLNKDNKSEKVALPKWVANAVLAERDLDEVPLLLGLSRAPVLRRDNSLADRFGFDKRTGWFVDFGSFYGLF